MPTRVAVIGATGSIGAQALEIISRFPQHFELIGAVAGGRVSALSEALRPFPSARAVLIEPDGDVPAGHGVRDRSLLSAGRVPGMLTWFWWAVVAPGRCCPPWPPAGRAIWSP